MNALPGNTQESGPPNVKGLIDWLLRTGRDADRDSRARTALAELRRGLRDDPRDRLIVGKYVGPFLGPDTPHERQGWLRWQEECCFLVAALFASHPAHARRVSLGAALGQLQERSGSIEGRFLGLLAARSERLRVPLRQAVGLLAANSVPLDWGMFLNDLVYWNDDEKRVQQRWARHFFHGGPDAALDRTPNEGMPDEDQD